MLRVVIRSRVGNAVLGVLGVLYLISATATLIYYVVTNWGGNSLTDYVLQLALFAAAIGGMFFLAIAVENLKPLRRDAAAKSRSTPDRRTAAAAGS